MAETLKMMVDVMADWVAWANQHGGFSIMLFLFTLTLWVEGTVGMFSGLTREWALDLAGALELPRTARILRGFLARSRRRAVKKAARSLLALDYAFCKLYLNVVDREHRHEERIKKERARHKDLVTMRVRHRITAPQRFVEQWFLDV